MAGSTSMERTLTALGHQQPDRVPVFLPVTMHGAGVLGTSIRDYFSRAENVVEGQLRLRERLGHDCLNPFFYAAVEAEAFGSNVVFAPDGPPNAGAPIVRDAADIRALEVPEPSHPRLAQQLAAIRGLAEAARGEVPVLGVAVAPFSLPVMLLGFGRYLRLLYEDYASFERLAAKLERFSVAWANAQLAAGATAITYFDPLSSPDMTPDDLFDRAGLPLAQRCLSRIDGPVAFHLGSARIVGRFDRIAGLGAAAVSVSSLEDIGALKAEAAGRIALIGNLNGIRMRRWTRQRARAVVERCVRAAAPGGGFVLSDNHGEIPFQVPLEVLTHIVEAAHDVSRDLQEVVDGD